ncbi:aldose epimerase family protein [Nocardioides xinjiangensis]|uniref:aldose epimerase family protein n=1 Tax=Nocardioides xinjiangensis TaxID=2817376 RepID=UPI001B311EC8|nr:aldose epimerase family protein [Nocardioides sp. SYSU D00778]
MTRNHVFGRLPDGRDVHLLPIGAAPGVEVEVLTLGATVHRMVVTGGDGERRNVVLGHPDVEERLASGDYVGGTIGRYANRIAAGRFPLAGREVEVRTHDRGNSLHGGPDGFDARLWDVVSHTADEVVLRLVSPDGDQGFPGAVTATARYVVDGDTVRVTMEATTDATTVVNLTNHAYLNLDGEGAGTIDGHLLAVEADEYTPVDATGIPLGGHATVAGTPFDLREPTVLGPALRAEHPQVVAARGIDHDYVVRGTGLRRAAVLSSPVTRTSVEVWSDQPGLQVYTGNFLDGTRRSTSGARYRQGDGIALEPQLFPDSPNRPEWPSPVLEPGETYRSTLEWRFSTEPVLGLGVRRLRSPAGTPAPRPGHG